MKDYEIQSIVSLLERSAKALEKSDDYRHKELAKDSDWCVRCFVAENPNTPIDVLTELAKDSDYDVRRNAARNPKLKEVLTDKK